MIPIVSISFLLISVVSFSCAALIWKRIGKKVLKTKFVNDLFCIYLISGIYFIIESVPSLLTRDGFLIQFFYIISDSLIVFLTAFIIKMPLSFFLEEKSRKLMAPLFCSAGAFSLFYFLFNILSIKPARPLQIGPVLIWAES